MGFSDGQFRLFSRIMRLLLNLNVLENFDIPIQYQASLTEFTTFRLGGNCPALLTCQTPQQLERAIQSCLEGNLKFILIGSGSNLLVSDEGVECLVIRYVSETPLIERQGNDVVVSGSMLLDNLAKYAAENGLEGLNCTTGIPGTLGGAIAGNAGAFGKQIGDVVQSVNILRTDCTPKELFARDLQFAYRNSILKQTGDIVVFARLSLQSGDHTALKKERNEILKLRREKHPDLITHPCAGSFFRNVEPTSKVGKRQAAGWFLEQAGGKNLKAGGATIFPRHANIIVKSEGCLAQDVFDLSGKMSQLVKDKFDLDLIREVRFVGKFNSMPEGVQDEIW